MQSDSDPPVCSSQALWAQVDDLEGLDFSKCECVSVSSIANPISTTGVLDGDAIIDTQGDGPESFSQVSSITNALLLISKMIFRNRASQLNPTLSKLWSFLQRPNVFLCVSLNLRAVTDF